MVALAVIIALGEPSQIVAHAVIVALAVMFAFGVPCLIVVKAMMVPKL